jgi:hypothetical protein
MRTKLIDGKSVSADDQVTMAALLEKTEAGEGDGLPMIIGIRNEAGEIYRALKTYGPHELLDVTHCLQSLGFTDEIGPYEPSREGCDAIFSRPPGRPAL